MDGLIVKQPFAQQLVSGGKKIEYRTNPIPDNKINKEILILTRKSEGCMILGTVFFTNQKWISTRNYEWVVDLPTKYNVLYHYKPKQGCVVWVKDVEIVQRINQQIDRNVNNV